MKRVHGEYVCVSYVKIKLQISLVTQNRFLPGKNLIPVKSKAIIVSKVAYVGSTVAD